MLAPGAQRPDPFCDVGSFCDGDLRVRNRIVDLLHGLHDVAERCVDLDGGNIFCQESGDGCAKRAPDEDRGRFASSVLARGGGDPVAQLNRLGHGVRLDLAHDRPHVGEREYQATKVRPTR